MDLSDEIRKLEEQHRAGTLSDSEFEAAKAAAIHRASELPPPPPPPFSGPAPDAPVPLRPAVLDPERRAREARDWGTWIHLSTLAGFLLPYAGYVVPIVLWQVKKDEFPEADVHGKVVVNWLISSTIYWIVSGILALFCIGIPLLIILGIVSIVFPIVGAVKAGKGEVWNYPGSIPFFR